MSELELDALLCYHLSGCNYEYAFNRYATKLGKLQCLVLLSRERRYYK